MAITEVKVDDITLTDVEDNIVVRLANGDVLEIFGEGIINVYTDDGAKYSHELNYVL